MTQEERALISANSEKLAALQIRPDGSPDLYPRWSRTDFEFDIRRDRI